MISGKLHVHASVEGFRTVCEDFMIRLELPGDYPESLPLVYEIRGRVPSGTGRRGFHKNDNGSLCLGAPIRLHMELHSSPSISRYVRLCLIPYLYQFVFAEAGDELPLGGLDHGVMGILDYYMGELKVGSPLAALGCIRLMGRPRLLGEAEPCPCGSGKPLRICHGFFVDRLREIRPRTWFAERHKILRRQYERVRDPKGVLARLEGLMWTEHARSDALDADYEADVYEMRVRG